ncbi:MAG TPA: T9SS type A sorting domain-containing protein [Cytophagaceae bacterium]
MILLKKHFVYTLFCLIILSSPFFGWSQRVIPSLGTYNNNPHGKQSKSSNFREASEYEYKIDSIVDFITRDGVQVPSFKYTFRHNIDGTVNHILYSRRNNIYQDSSSYTYIDRQKSEVISYEKNPRQAWVKMQHEVNNYEGNRLISRETQRFDSASGSMKPAYKYIYSYNSLGNISGYDFLVPNYGQRTLEEYTRSIYYYNEKQWLDSIAQIQWNGRNNLYENETIVEFKYNELGQQTSYSVRRNRLNDQIPLNKRETTYDENGNISRFLDFSWDVIKGVWQRESKNELKFSPMYNVNNTCIPFEELEDLSAKGSISSSEISSWNPTTAQWEKGYFSQAYYSKLIPTKTSQKANTDINIFPNPTTDLLDIHSTSEYSDKKISIRNIFGEEVLQENCSGIQNQISLRRLGAGTYLITIETKGSIYTNKLLVL